MFASRGEQLVIWVNELTNARKENQMPHLLEIRIPSWPALLL